MLMMRFAATLGVLIGICASCLGVEIIAPRIGPETALLGLLLSSAYVASEATDFTTKMNRRWKQRRNKRSESTR